MVGLLSRFVNLLWLKPSFDVRFSLLKKTGWHRKSEISARVGHNFYGWYGWWEFLSDIFRAWDDDQDYRSFHLQKFDFGFSFSSGVGVHHFRFKIRFSEASTEMAGIFW